MNNKETEHSLSFGTKTCPTCNKEGELIQEGFRTCVAYINIDGAPHDGNCIEGVFECEDNHRFFATTHYLCSCGWSAVRECTISGHDKTIPIHNKDDNIRDIYGLN